MKIIRPVQVAQTGTITRASAATYWDKTGTLQSAANDTPRVCYDPSDLTKAPYVLLEQAASNIIAYSNDLSQSAWLKNSLTGVGTKSYSGPFGPNSAWSVVEDATNSIHELRTPGITLTSGVTYTQSVFAKAGGRQWLRSGFSAVFSSAGTSYAVFDLSNGTVAYTTGSNITASIQSVGNGWYRCSTTMTATISTNGTNYIGPQNAAYAPSHQGDGSSNIFLCGFQLEVGSVATSYISTDTGGLYNRSADVVTGTGLMYSNVTDDDGGVYAANGMYYGTWPLYYPHVFRAGEVVSDSSTHKLYLSTNGVRGTVTFDASGNATLIDATTGLAYVPVVGMAFQPQNSTPPSPLVNATVYYVQSVTGSTFTVAATAGGAKITTAAGSCTAAVGTNDGSKPLTDTNNWLDAGATNRWEMFDQSITSQSSANSEIVVVLRAGQRIDSLVGLNIKASRATVAMTDTTTGAVVYQKVVSLTSSSTIGNWYGYFYEPIVRLTDFVLTDLPVGPSSDGLVLVRFEESTSALVGGLVLGLGKEIGVTEYGTKLGITDYSVKTRDSFGSYTITPRAFSKKADFTVQVETDSVDFIHGLLSQYRTTPVVYIGSNTGAPSQYNSTVIYGFYKDFSIDIAYKSLSVCTLSVEGLT